MLITLEFDEKGNMPLRASFKWPGGAISWPRAGGSGWVGGSLPGWRTSWQPRQVRAEEEEEEEEVEVRTIFR